MAGVVSRAERRLDMKRAALLLVAVLAVPLATQAQELKVGVGLMGGILVPTSGEFKDFYSAGPELGGELILRGEQVDIGIGASVYFKTGSSVFVVYDPYSGTAGAGARVSSDLDGRLIPVLATVRYRFAPPASKATGYIGFGGGIYSFNEEIKSMNTSASKTGFGAHISTGFESKMGTGSARFYLEARTSYASLGEHELTGENVSLTSITVCGGVRF